MGPFNILLIEDNEGDIFLTSEAFESIKTPNILSIARDGKEALDFLKQVGKYHSASKPDMILLDINLPKLNGHEVLKFIKVNNKLKGIPVIVLTTSNSDSDISLTYQNYANCYIIKPFGKTTFDDIAINIENFWMSLVSLPDNTRSNN